MEYAENKQLKPTGCEKAWLGWQGNKFKVYDVPFLLSLLRFMYHFLCCEKLVT
jgi:hypothetical protein